MVPKRGPSHNAHRRPPPFAIVALLVVANVVVIVIANDVHVRTTGVGRKPPLRTLEIEAALTSPPLLPPLSVIMSVRRLTR